mmetsp:Transcript_18134/g.45541  ORF Transcript_18134/g.45541 Transcript_18134/m.45541 type:complete len:204 (-) Transcript_18134:744-1355(-)
MVQVDASDVLHDNVLGLAACDVRARMHLEAGHALRALPPRQCAVQREVSVRDVEVAARHGGHHHHAPRKVGVLQQHVHVGQPQRAALHAVARGQHKAQAAPAVVHPPHRHVLARVNKEALLARAGRHHNLHILKEHVLRELRVQRDDGGLPDGDVGDGDVVAVEHVDHGDGRDVLPHVELAVAVDLAAAGDGEVVHVAHGEQR